MVDKEEKDKKVKIAVVEESGSEGLEEKEAENKVRVESKPKEEKEKTQELTLPTKEKPQIWLLVFMFLVGLTLGAGLIGGIFYYRSSMNKAFPKEKKVLEFGSPTATPIPTLAPETSEKLDLSKYSLQILNGSGIAGEAKKVEGLLNKVGFSQTETGNAVSYGFTSSEIAAKTKVPSEILNKIKDSLSLYEFKDSVELKESSSFDIVVTIGKGKAN